MHARLDWALVRQQAPKIGVGCVFRPKFATHRDTQIEPTCCL